MYLLQSRIDSIHLSFFYLLEQNMGDEGAEYLNKQKISCHTNVDPRSRSLSPVQSWLSQPRWCLASVYLRFLRCDTSWMLSFSPKSCMRKNIHWAASNPLGYLVGITWPNLQNVDMSSSPRCFIPAGSGQFTSKCISESRVSWCALMYQQQWLQNWHSSACGCLAVQWSGSWGWNASTTSTLLSLWKFEELFLEFFWHCLFFLLFFDRVYIKIFYISICISIFRNTY